MRKTEFANGEYYHIFNRGVEKRKVFLNSSDYSRFLRSIIEFNVTQPIGSLYENYLRKKSGHFVSTKETNKLADVICYCLNPNHYHFILKQLQNKGIEKFMQRLGNGYTKYFNHKNDRSGVLFQGVFKSVHIDSNEQLLYVSAYVNMNHFIHGYDRGHEMSTAWRYCSFSDYLTTRKENFCNTRVILNQFKNAKEYEKFINDNALYMKEKREMEKYMLE